MRARIEPAHLLALTTLVGGISAPCYVTDSSAAALHEFDGFHLRPPFHVLVPRGRNIQRANHCIHVSNMIEPADVATVTQIACTSAARTLLSLAATHPAEAVTRALDSALRDGKVTEDYLHRQIARWRAPGRNGVRALLDVIAGAEAIRGGHSWLEREFLRVMTVAGLPRPVPQEVLGRRRDRHLIRVDFRFPGTMVVVEVLGYRFHRTRSQLIGDVERTNELQALGYRVVQFSYHHVVAESEYVVEKVRRALEADEHARLKRLTGLTRGRASSWQG